MLTKFINMIYLYTMQTIFRQLISSIIILSFAAIVTPSAKAQEIVLPKPGVRVSMSPLFNPAALKGIRVHADNPFKFDFLLDKGDTNLSGQALKDEAAHLIKYFMASLTIPEKDLWVNLSPYEKRRIIPESFGQTDMGKDLLAQDYMLKQITASLIYPEDQFGKTFWKRVYEEAQKRFGTTYIQINTFNKVWIVPETAIVYENASAGTAYVAESKLKVLLEQDYLSLANHAGISGSVPVLAQNVNQIGSQIVKEIVIPLLNKEINEGKNFSQLRQVYQSLILAAWYKKKIKDSLLQKIYINQNKTPGIDIANPTKEKQNIYNQYLKAFKKGAYNYIKEERDPVTLKTVPRKYFSGGAKLDLAMVLNVRPAEGMSFSGNNNLTTIGAIMRRSYSNPSSLQTFTSVNSAMTSRRTLFKSFLIPLMLPAIGLSQDSLTFEEKVAKQKNTNKLIELFQKEIMSMQLTLQNFNRKSPDVEALSKIIADTKTPGSVNHLIVVAESIKDSYDRGHVLKFLGQRVDIIRNATNAYLVIIKRDRFNSQLDHIKDVALSLNWASSAINAPSPEKIESFEKQLKLSDQFTNYLKAASADLINEFNTHINYKFRESNVIRTQIAFVFISGYNARVVAQVSADAYLEFIKRLIETYQDELKNASSSDQEKITKKITDLLARAEQIEQWAIASINSINALLAEQVAFQGEDKYRKLPELVLMGEHFTLKETYQVKPKLKSFFTETAKSFVEPNAGGSNQAMIHQNIDGGIDLTADQLNVKINNNGGTIKFTADPAMLKLWQDAPGFFPVITTFSPSTNIPTFLGLNKTSSQEQLAKI